MSAVREATSPEGRAIRVRGQVQGVGFRPTVWRLAHECGLRGDVRNDAEGVMIHVWGEPFTLDQFLFRLREEPPPLARVDEVESAPLDGAAPTRPFHIVASQSGAVHTGVVPDAGTCPACLGEVMAPSDRRYRYPFTNCTHCGPRLSIVRSIPYDRAHTSMGSFAMCADCRAEYEAPADRRFHAQPNACPVCGPRVRLLHMDGRDVDCFALDAADEIEAASRMLAQGTIIAIKGLGGFHLACDAGDARAVVALRARKQRYHKPFALMARDIDVVRNYADVSEQEAALLHSPAAPIVLLRANGCVRVADAVAPKQGTLGFMLPYTPLHHLLLQEWKRPIVLTSGNRSDEPQCIGNNEARETLADIADAVLLHDRDIVNRVDDSVVKFIAGAPVLLRRARGYAPASLRLPADFAQAPPVLALGGELKNTFCLLRDGEAIVSQHLGDLENAAANAACKRTLKLYLEMYGHVPRVLVIDAHPDYLPSKFGREWTAASGIRQITVQHHHAHIAACMADNGVELDTPPVFGIALDGLGYGDDGTLWGGEFLLADYLGFERVASFMPVAMPGGTQAIRQPWRMAYAHLRRVGNWPQLASEHASLPFFRALNEKPLATLDHMIDAGFNSPLTSSAGRLFDAVAAVIGLCHVTSYEGQAAIELEAVVDSAALRDDNHYHFSIVDVDGLPRLEPVPMWRALLRDLRGGVSVAVMAARFHAGLARAIAEMIEYLAHPHGDRWPGRIALSGGVFQNAILSEQLISLLESNGMEVLRHARVPANDGGLSLGQAVIAAARSISHDQDGAWQ